MTDDQLWAFLYYAGYITGVSHQSGEFQLPNWELRSTFGGWLKRYLGPIIQATAAGSTRRVTIEDEAEFGRLDMKIEEVHGTRGVIVEFQVTNAERTLNSTALDGLQHRAKFSSSTLTLQEYGIAFWKKKCAVVGRSLRREDGVQWVAGD